MARQQVANLAKSELPSPARRNVLQHLPEVGHVLNQPFGSDLLVEHFPILETN